MLLNKFDSFWLKNNLDFILIGLFPLCFPSLIEHLPKLEAETILVATLCINISETPTP